MTKPLPADQLKPKLQWSVGLYGTPCTFCGEAAEKMAVYDVGRVVVHINRMHEPCKGINPGRSETPLDTLATDVA